MFLSIKDSIISTNQSTNMINSLIYISLEITSWLSVIKIESISIICWFSFENLIWITYTSFLSLINKLIFLSMILFKIKFVIILLIFPSKSIYMNSIRNSLLIVKIIFLSTWNWFLKVSFHIVQINIESRLI